MLYFFYSNGELKRLFHVFSPFPQSVRISERTITLAIMITSNKPITNLSKFSKEIAVLFVNLIISINVINIFFIIREMFYLLYNFFNIFRVIYGNFYCIKPLHCNTIFKFDNRFYICKNLSFVSYHMLGLILQLFSSFCA